MVFDKSYLTGMEFDVLGKLLSMFDGENVREQKENYQFGVLAQNFPEKLSKKDIFTISFLIERMQNCKFGDVTMLEKIRLFLMSGL